MDLETGRQHLLQQIRQHAEREYQAGSMMVMRTQLKVCGVRTPHLRQITCNWQRAHKQVTHEDLLALVEMLWDGESQEERALGMELLVRYRRRIPDLTWDHFDRWRRKVDNWGLTHGLGISILVPWLLADPHARLSRSWDLIAEEDAWSRRVAPVATVPINRGHTLSPYPT